MCATIHLTSGDMAGEALARAGLAGEVFVWHDILYDGPRRPGWPDDATLQARARWLEGVTGGGLDRDKVLDVLRRQYRKLADVGPGDHLVLWFDACLFDQSMLAHILTCLAHTKQTNAELICVEAFPGIDPFHGLGQLRPEDLAGLYPGRVQVTPAHYGFAWRVDTAFATQDPALFAAVSATPEPPLPWVGAAVRRWLQERPDPQTGLGRLEHLALAAIRAGCETPADILASVAAAETPPRFWGETTLWARINGLADRVPPLVRIDGPGGRLPQWADDRPLTAFSVHALPDRPGPGTRGDPA